jgi:hypothetical protein
VLADTIPSPGLTPTIITCNIKTNRLRVLSCRLHFDPSTGTIKDQWTWRGATADEAAWLLSRSYKHVDVDRFLDTTSSSSGSGSGRRGTVDGDEAQRARAKGAAMAFREVFGAVPGANVANLTTALSDDYQCKVSSLKQWWAVDGLRPGGHLVQVAAL